MFMAPYSSGDCTLWTFVQSAELIDLMQRTQRLISSGLSLTIRASHAPAKNGCPDRHNLLSLLNAGDCAR